MAQYLLSVVQPAGPIPPADELEQIGARLDALNAEMKAAGVWVFAGALHPPNTATVLRPNGNDVLMTDGPFAEGKEFLGGFTIIDADDLDAALDWGRRLAETIPLPIEVRPFQGA
ncbi:YciI family protein [Antrihabitans sp. YC2-6]|uniref:YciI family protein n=1 Tax=Antrihabitans sp. YC2-6 TaxID=2799498 RepID=UPI0018F47681|nr:YciI family protein [Antrihabitans sp. YC2-6]MBJ8348439.1 hypothetical protein [Antrihabitans sp. YC2-6]